MGLMGSLYVGASGLHTSQNALNTTGHNLANVDTTGYVRQQVYLSDKSYSTIGYASVSKMQTGFGVNYAEVRQIRDYFLDQTYRTEAGRAAFYTTTANVASEVEVLFGELEGVAFQDSLADLWESVQELCNNPGNSVNQSAFIEQADLFFSRAKNIYSALNVYQDNLNKEIVSTVNTINDLGNKIYDLNNKIVKIEAGGLENANDLRDERNLALDELSKLVKIQYSEDANGRVTVNIEGSQFITDTNVNSMGLKVIDSGTGFVMPVWPDQNNQEVFNLNVDIDANLNTDIGKLKALVVARGDHRANYTDLSDTEYYNTMIQPSTIMSIQAEFDQLIHGIATAINDALCGVMAVTPGSEPVELFVRLGTDRYDTSGNYIVEDKTSYNTLYTLGNMIINPEFKKNESLLNFTKEDGEVDQEKANAIKNTFVNKFSSLNPNNQQVTYTFLEYYNAMIIQQGTDTNILNSMAKTMNDTVAATDYKRQAVLGVSSDEELSNMIMFQNAYNASSRYITTINDLLDQIIQSLGA